MPLSPEEGALLKLAAWLDGFGQRTDDLVVSFDSEGLWFELVLSPRRGFVVQVGHGEDPTQSHKTDLAAVCSQQQLAIVSLKDQKRYVVDFNKGAFAPVATFSLVTGSPKWSGKGGINFWVNYRSYHSANNRTNTPSPIGPRLAPSAALSVVRKHHAKCSWDGPILTARWNDRRLVIDSRDGRLIELAHTNSRRLFSKIGTGEKTTATAEPVPGQFDTRKDEIARATTGFATVADPQRLASSLAEFVCQQMVNLGLLTDDKSTRLIAAIVRLSQRAALQPIDDLFAAAMWRQPERFYIPAVEPLVPDALSFQASTNGFRLAARQLIVGLADELFMRGTHPWLVWREAAFIMNGKREHMHQRLASNFPVEQTGPLTTLAFAGAMRASGMDDEAGNWVRPRLEYISLDGFRRDYAAFIQPGSRVSNYVLGTAEAMRALDESETKALFDFILSLKWMTKSQTRQVIAFHKELRRDPTRPTPAALAAALDALWQTNLQYRIQNRLKTIAESSPQPVQQQPQGSRRRLLFR